MTDARLTIRKSGAQPFQEVTLVDEDFTELARETLTESRPELVRDLAPGRYQVSYLTPGGARGQTTVALGSGERRDLGLDAPAPSPHEWLADVAARQQLPRSVAGVTREVVRALGSWPLREILAASPMASLSLPSAPVALAAQGLVQEAETALTGRLQRQERPKQATRRPGDVSIRSYAWSPERGRWLRSDLIERAEGQHAMDYTRLFFPGRPGLPAPLANQIHLIGVLREGSPARFIALPLFASGSALVLSQRVAAEPTAEPVSWFLTANDARVDAILQALRGRGFEGGGTVSDEVSSLALRVGLDDPEAAVVAAFYLLRERRPTLPIPPAELAARAPWSPDALALRSWVAFLETSANPAEVLAALAEVHPAGPPQFQYARRLLRDMLSIRREGDVPTQTRDRLDRLWRRLGREMQQEIPAGPFFAYAQGALREEEDPET